VLLTKFADGKKFTLFIFERESRKSHNEEIEEMENFVFGIFPISRSHSFSPPHIRKGKTTHNFRYYLFCFIVVVAVDESSRNVH
jgi:hypothetical protein